MNWYYAQGDQRQGPISDADLDALLAAGTINENTLVWRDGMTNWAPLKEARPAAAADVPAGWIRCTATGRYFPPEEIVYLDGKPYSAAAKPGVLQEVLQTGALPSSDVERNGPPWENRKQIGFFPAVWQTARGALTEPGATFAKMRREGGLGAPLGYFILTGWSGGFVTLLFQALLQFGTRAAVPQGQQQPFPFVWGPIVFVIWWLLLPVLLVLGSFIMSGIFHLSLMLCQGARQPFETTYRTYCYAMGSGYALQLIPVCGMYASGIWGLVSLCIGIAKTHEIGSGRAVLAILLPVGVCCVAMIFVFVIAFGSIMAAQGTHH